MGKIWPSWQDPFYRKIKPYDEREYAAAELLIGGEMSAEEVAGAVGLPNADEVKAAARLPQIQNYLAAALDQATATVERSAKAIADAHDAQDMRTTKNGEKVDVGPDHTTRLKAAELNMKLRGHLRESAGQVNLFAGLTDQQLAAIATGLLDPATLVDVGPRIKNREAIETAAEPPTP